MKMLTDDRFLACTISSPIMSEPMRMVLRPFIYSLIRKTEGQRMEPLTIKLQDASHGTLATPNVLFLTSENAISGIIYSLL